MGTTFCMYIVNKNINNNYNNFDLYEHVCLEFLLQEVKCRDFYRDIFPSGSFEKQGEFENGKYNAILVSIDPKTYKAKRYTVTDDLKVLSIQNKTDNFNVIAPISYAGKSRKSENARYLYALAIDLDGVSTLDRFEFLLSQFERPVERMVSIVSGMPKPTYLVASGTGLHLYYVFEKPIRLYPSNAKELEKLKRQLTWQCWTQGASSLHDNVQYESLFQGFRAIGSITKTGTRVKAFKIGEKTTVEYLNQCVPLEKQANIHLRNISQLPIDIAREQYPEWYEKRIIKGEKKGSWTNNKALYNWWLRRAGEVEEGHRYWYIMTLATYAIKCDVDFKQLKEDALSVKDLLNKDCKEPFTNADIKSALTAYSESYRHYPIHTIVNRTGLEIKRNKRNGRKQRVHLEVARATQSIIDRANGTNWRENNGRPSKQNIVKQWKLEHPNSKKIDCERETGLSRPTVLKWWSS